MNILPWLILMLVVILGTVGQLSLKYAFQSPKLQGETNSLVRSLLFSPYFWTWFTCYILVTGLWLVILRTIPLSQAFPALGLTFALVPLASQKFLHEKVVFSQWIGISIIITGAILVVQK